MNGEPIVYDPATDTLLVELRPWPSASPAEVNEEVGGEDVEEGLVVHYGPDGQPHAFEIEHASERPDLVARALSALRHAKGFAARWARSPKPWPWLIDDPLETPIATPGRGSAAGEAGALRASLISAAGPGQNSPAVATSHPSGTTPAMRGSRRDDRVETKMASILARCAINETKMSIRTGLLGRSFGCANLLPTAFSHEEFCRKVERSVC